MTLPDCTLTVGGPADPSNPASAIDGNLALSPNHESVTYGIDKQVIVWDLRDRQIRKQLNISPLWMGRDIAYTPDGKLLIVSANTSPLTADNKRLNYLLIYDTQTYQLVRRIWVLGTTALAVSPDSRTLAVAYTQVEEPRGIGGIFSPTTEKGIIVLYDISTGEELARAAHPRVKQTHNDPFAAQIDSLAFTPDGEYLLSSTNETRVWQVSPLSINSAKH